MLSETFYCIKSREELSEIIDKMREGLKGIKLDEIIGKLKAGEEVVIKIGSNELIKIAYRPYFGDEPSQYPVKISYIIEGKGITIEIDIGKNRGSRVYIKYEGPIKGFRSLANIIPPREIPIVYGILLRKGINPLEYLKCVKEGEFEESDPYKILQNLKERI